MASSISNMPLEIPTNMENKANPLSHNPCGSNISRLCFNNSRNNRYSVIMDALNNNICHARNGSRYAKEIRKNLKPLHFKGEKNAKTQSLSDSIFNCIGQRSLCINNPYHSIHGFQFNNKERLCYKLYR